MKADLILGSVLLAGCGVVPGETGTESMDGTSTQTDSGSSSTASVTSMGGSTGISAGGSTFAPTTTSGVDDTAGSTGDIGETAGSVCDPQPESMNWWAYINDEKPRDGFYIVIDADCIVQGVAEDGPARLYDLECDEGGPVHHELEIVRNPGGVDLPMDVGTAIQLRVAKDFPIDTGGSNYIVVRDALGEILFGYYGGGTLPAELGVDLDQWFAPLAFTLVSGVCDPEPFEEPPSNFIQDPCPSIDTRLAIDFALGDAGIQLVDRTSGQLGEFDLFVNAAVNVDGQTKLCDIPFDVMLFSVFRTPR